MKKNAQNICQLKNNAYLCNAIAKIAQLVEHNLAKVGVAGSSPVFRSKDAAVVESVDTQDLKSCDHCDRAGSSPACGTRKTTCHLWQVVFFVKSFLCSLKFFIFLLMNEVKMECFMFIVLTTI